MNRSLNETVAAPVAVSEGGCVWTPEYLAFVLPLTPEDVLKAGTGRETGCLKASRLEWCWIQTAQRLADQHGAAEALRRLNGYGA